MITERKIYFEYKLQSYKSKLLLLLTITAKEKLKCDQ